VLSSSRFPTFSRKTSLGFAPREIFQGEFTCFWKIEALGDALKTLWHRIAISAGFSTSPL